MIQKNRGRPKGAPNKFKKIALKSSRRQPSAFEKVVEKKVRRKVVKGKGKKKEKTPEDVSNFSIIFFLHPIDCSSVLLGLCARGRGEHQ